MPKIASPAAEGPLKFAFITACPTHAYQMHAAVSGQVTALLQPPGSQDWA